MTFRIRIVQVLFIATFFMMLFWQLDPVNPKDAVSIQNRLGALFFVSINMFIMYFQTSVALFPVERDIFLKEFDSGLYSLIPYFFAKIIIDLPLTALFPMLFSSIVYYAVSFYSPVEHFFFFMLGTVLMCWMAVLFGIFIGSIVSDANVAIEIAPMIFVPMILFSGYTTNTENIVIVLKGLEYLSPVRYAFEFFVHNEFGWRDIDPVNPVDTLNFDLSIWKITLIFLGYCFFLIIMSMVFLKIGSLKGFKNK